MLLKAGDHRLASETPFECRFAGEPMMAQHLMLAWFTAFTLWFFRRSRPVLLRNPIFTVIVRGERTACHPSGSTHANNWQSD